MKILSGDEYGCSDSLGTVVASSKHAIWFVEKEGYSTTRIRLKSDSSIVLSARKDLPLVPFGLEGKDQNRFLGYHIAGSEIQTDGQQNFLIGLSGKLNGLNLMHSSGVHDGSLVTLLRGANSFMTQVAPLIVIDGLPMQCIEMAGEQFDYGQLLQAINPAEIEHLEFHSAGIAKILYGAAARSGVIMIKTKTGANQPKGISVDVGSAVMVDQVRDYPRLQNRYGGGLSNDFEERIVGDQTYSLVDYAADESWGPMLNGQQVVHFHNLEDGASGVNINGTSPWVFPEKDESTFFKSALHLRNRIGLNGQYAKGNFRLVYERMDGENYLPNSSYQRDFLKGQGAMMLGRKVRLETSLNYYQSAYKGRVNRGGVRNPFVQMWQWGQRQLDYGMLGDYKHADGSQKTWNRYSFDSPQAKYHLNPYWIRMEDYQNDEQQRFYGHIGLNVNLSKYLDLRVRTYFDQAKADAVERKAFLDGQAGLEERRNINWNQDWGQQELFLNFHDFSKGKLHIGGLGGIQYQERRLAHNHYIYAFNQQQQNLIAISTLEEQVRQYDTFAFLNPYFKWDNIFRLDLAYRKQLEANVAREEDDLYSLGGQFNINLKELHLFKEVKWMGHSFLNIAFTKMELGEQWYGYEDIRFGDMSPVEQQEWSIAFQSSLRAIPLTIGLQWFRQDITNALNLVSVSSNTGYSAQGLSEGAMRNHALELNVGIDWVRQGVWQWNSTLLSSWNRNEVKKIAEGLPMLKLQEEHMVSPYAQVGLPFGQLRLRDFQYHENGQPILVNGKYLMEDEASMVGTVYPDFRMSLSNQLRYKDFSFSFLIERSRGGYFFSEDHQKGMYAGLLEATVAGGIREEGIQLEGYETGTPQKMTAREYGGMHHNEAQILNVLDACYVKLREARLNWRIPNGKLVFLYDLNIGLFGRNLWTWGLDKKGFDPEAQIEVSRALPLGRGSAIAPSVASYGMEVGFKF
ncbi:hypothetical protein [Persicobacter diffluens]|uniref:hypothetical protein n=1 Tax=Persicobacter diffluens TaxID=981 RepID=UPI0030C66212